uniref:Uncharacterized protein n=1 Tax=Ascaris lumbricoides TaxID=6252 RepID=A0A9J2PYY7_ASCLU
MFFCNQSPHIPGFVVLLMIGFAVCSIAIVTPAWQISFQVTVVPELNMTVQHGLWMSCQKRCIFYSCFDISAPKVAACTIACEVIGINFRMHGIFVCLYSFAEQDDYNKTATRELSVFSPIFAGDTALFIGINFRMHGIFVCLYSFAEQDDYNKTATRELSVFSPIFAGYQHFVLSLFIFAQVLVFLCIGLYALSKYIQLHSHISFFYDIATVVASILCAAGCIIFAIFSKLEKYSAFDGETTTHQRDGKVSLMLAVFGTFPHLYIYIIVMYSFTFCISASTRAGYDSALISGQDMIRPSYLIQPKNFFAFADSCDFKFQLQLRMSRSFSFYMMIGGALIYVAAFNARKITIGSSHERSMDDDDDATFSKRKLDEHLRDVCLNASCYRHDHRLRTVKYLGAQTRVLEAVLNTSVRKVFSTVQLAPDEADL